MDMDGGKKSPWLAMSFGCCASHRDSFEEEDEGRAALRANGESEMQICYDQPASVSQPKADLIHARPPTSYSMGRHVSQWAANTRDFATRASSRASVYTLTRPRKSHSRPRPSIGQPMNFRHYDGLDGSDGIQSMLDDAPVPVRRRRSFRPLELSIYLPEGRLSPLPDFELDEWNKLPAELEMPAQALVRDRDSRTNSIASNPSTTAPTWLINRKPVGTGSRRSSLQSQNSVQSRPLSATLSALPFLLEEPRSRPESIISTPNSLSRANTYGTLSPNRILSRLPSPSRSRANTAPSRPGSVRRAKTDVDEAIRELNTIVEERRADAYRSQNYSPSFGSRPPPSPSSHVPAIAPSLRMHVRSETLSDIGSAFSVPLASKPLPTPPGTGTLSRSTTGKLTLAPPKRTFSGPLDSNPITPPTPTMPTPTSPIHRLGAWLKRSLPTTPSSPLNPSRPSTSKSSASTTASPFYQCEPHQHIPSRPSTAGSKTVVHTRHTSNETATVTLLSSYPSTPSLSTRSLSSDFDPATESPATPARINILKGEGKTRKIPAPLTLSKEKELAVEAALGSALSTRSSCSERSLRPPPSPNYGILRGMEISARQSGVRRSGCEAVLASPGAVGVAF